MFSTAHIFFYENEVGDIDPMFEYAGNQLKHVIFADTFDHKAPSGLSYIVSPPGVEATVH